MKIIPFLCLLIFARSLFGQSLKPVDQWLDQNLASLVATYKQLHASPEISGYETHTSARIAGRLKELGYTVAEHLGKFTHRDWTGYGVVGIFKNGIGPTLLIRTEMDALPLVEKTNLPYASIVKVKTDSAQETGVMHACGHDIHMSIFLGLADILMQLKTSWQGTLMLVAQPSEEGGPGASGAQALLEDGLYARFGRPDFILGLHQTPTIISGKVALKTGFSNATSRDGEIIIRGTGSHAARPQDGKDPIVLSAELIMALQTIISRENDPFHPAVLTIGSIHGGTRSNIIPDQVNLKFTLRALDDETGDKLASAILRIARGVAYAAGLSEDKYPEIILSKGYPANYNDPEFTEEIAAAFRKALGKENVLVADPVLSGEDFSYYSLEKKIPSLFFNIGGADPARFNESLKTGIPLPSNHSPFMAPAPELTIRTGIKAMVAAAFRLLQDAAPPGTTIE